MQNVECGICFSLINDGIAPSDIFVSPPNSNSQDSMIPVGTDGCITITSADEGRSAILSKARAMLGQMLTACSSLIIQALS